MSRYGSRITDGGYQAPSTASAQLKRGQTIRKHTATIGTARVELTVTPLEGGRPELYEVAMMANDPVRRHTEYVPCMVRGRELADRAFAMTAASLDAGRLPDRIILPDGAPLGW